MAEETGWRKVGRRFLELGVYLPVGLTARLVDRVRTVDGRALRKSFGETVAEGEHLTTETVRAGRKAMQRRARAVEEGAEAAGERIRGTAERISERGEAVVHAVAPTVPGVAAPASASELALPGYEELTAHEIIEKLDGLTQTELSRIYTWEQAHENRVTVLRAIESRLESLPIPDYDALTAEEISGRLQGLSDQELETLREYEKRTKGRVTVIEQIDHRLAA